MLQRGAVRSGHAHHIAECREDDAGVLRHREAIVDPAHRQHAHRAAGAVYQLDIGRQQILQAEAVDGVGVSPAHFHEAIVPAGIGEPTDFLSGFADYLGRTEFVDVFHDPFFMVCVFAPLYHRSISDPS